MRIDLLVRSATSRSSPGGRSAAVIAPCASGVCSLLLTRSVKPGSPQSAKSAYGVGVIGAGEDERFLKGGDIAGSVLPDTHLEGG